MDGDEILALAVGCALSFWGALRWYGSIFRATWIKPRILHRITFVVLPIGCLWLTAIVRRWAAVEVRTDVGYQVLFLAGEGAWLTLACIALPCFGVDPRDDVLECGNWAAALVTLAAFVGVTLCYCGANIGEGATIWTTFIPAVVATLLFFSFWLAINLTTKIPTAVAIERSMVTAFVLGGLLIANGAILGRAAAGNWVSVDNTLGDCCRLGWPAAGLTAVIATVYRALDR